MGISAYATVVQADGGEKRAEDVAAGDALLNPASGAAATVRKLWQGPAVGMYRLTLATGVMLDLTEDQKVMTDAGLVQAGQVRPGSQLRTMDGFVACSEAYGLPGDFMVYDIVLENAGAGPCVAANRIWVGV